MRVVLISGAFPPAIDGIGDHTFHLARTLSARHEVRVFTAHAKCFCPSPGVSVTGCFDASAARSIWQVVELLEDFSPDEVILQFNPFSFGARGFNPWLPWMLVRARKNLRFRLTVIFHETVATPESVRSGLLWLSHLPQFALLCRTADRICVSTMRWAKQIRRFSRHAEITHLAVGSGVDKSKLSQAEAKQILGMDSQTVVLGIFGSKHPSRLMEWSAQAVVALSKSASNITVLYIGEDGSYLARLLDKQIRLVDCGPLEREKAGDCIVAMDVMLAPFSDGISTRRSSAMAGLQHGVPLLSTRSIHTEGIFLSADDRIILSSVKDGLNAYTGMVAEHISKLTMNSALRHKIAAFYEGNFSWEQIVRRIEL